MVVGLSEKHWEILCRLPSQEETCPGSTLIVSRSDKSMINSCTRSREESRGNENDVQLTTMQIRRDCGRHFGGNEAVSSCTSRLLGGKIVSDQFGFGTKYGDSVSGHPDGIPKSAAGSLGHLLDTTLKTVEVSFSEPKPQPSDMMVLERLEPEIPPAERLMQEMLHFSCKVQENVENSSRNFFDRLSSLMHTSALHCTQQSHSLSALKQSGTSPLSRVHKVRLRALFELKHGH